MILLESLLKPRPTMRDSRERERLCSREGEHDLKYWTGVPPKSMSHELRTKPSIIATS